MSRPKSTASFAAELPGLVQSITQAKSDKDFIAAIKQLQQLVPEATERLVLPARLELFRQGLPQAVATFMSSAAAGFPEVLSWGWTALIYMSAPFEAGTAEERTMVMASQLDKIHTLIAAELAHRPPRDEPLVRLLAFLSALSLVPESARGLVTHAPALVALLGSNQVGFQAVGILKNLSQLPTSRPAAFPGCLDAALLLLELLNSPKNAKAYKMGLDAASLVINLFGRDEFGPGAEAIRGNASLVVDKLVLLLAQVLDTPDALIYMTTWNPASIVSDLHVLAQADMNKVDFFIVVRLTRNNHQPLLVGCVKMLVKALSATDAKTAPLAVLSLKTLLLLSFELALCKPALLECKPEAALKQHPQPEARLLLDWLSAPGLWPRARSPSERIKAAKRDALVSFAEDDAEAGQALCSYLTQNKLVDAQASTEDYQSDFCVFVCLVSRAYKGSGRVRTELLSAKALSKPLVVVRMDGEEFKADGWLGFALQGATISLDWGSDTFRADLVLRISELLQQPPQRKKSLLPPPPASDLAQIKQDLAGLVRDVHEIKGLLVHQRVQEQI